jgi:hypothetical protein
MRTQFRQNWLSERDESSEFEEVQIHQPATVSFSAAGLALPPANTNDSARPQLSTLSEFGSMTSASRPNQSAKYDLSTFADLAGLANAAYSTGAWVGVCTAKYPSQQSLILS